MAGRGRFTLAFDVETTGDYHRFVKSVGIKTLKAKLSEYVRLAKAGETILVTERDEVVAELRPASRERPAAGSLEEYLQELGERGEATVAAETDSDWAGIVPVGRAPTGTTDKVLDELRGERL